MKNSEDADYKKKVAFLTLIDGIDAYPGYFKGINSFVIGICKLEVIDDILHIYLRRPGLLIGYRGHQINKLAEDLGFGIKIHEVDLLRKSPEIIKTDFSISDVQNTKFLSILRRLKGSLLRFFRNIF